MIELLEQINSTYLQRTTDILEQKRIWIKLSGRFRPDLAQYRAGRPSVIIARETGDLGLSVLWIVQTALIRPILKEIVLNAKEDKDLSAMLLRINQNSLCALAHSENSAMPAILNESNNKFTLNGEKKFITAGENAEVIIVTCRIKGDEKISRIAIIDPDNLPAGSLPDLKLDIMRSVSHTKLILNNTELSDFQIPRIAPIVIRRMIKKSGILERALIFEAFPSFLLYAAKILTASGTEISETDEISAILELQTASATKQIEESVYGENINTANVPIQRLFPLIDTFKKAYIKAESRLSESDRIKLKDIFLFDNLKG